MESFWTWLGTPPGNDEILGPFGLFCLLFFLPGFVISAYLAGSAADRLAKDPVQLAGLRYCATIGLWVFGAGIFFFGIRVMQINPLSFGEPKWLVVSLVAILLAAWRCVDTRRSNYSVDIARRSQLETITQVANPENHVSGARAGQTILQTTERK